MLVRPRAATSVTQQQWRGLASGGKSGKSGKGGKGGKGRGGDGGGGKEEGVFGRLKKTFEEEIEKVRSCQQHAATAFVERVGKRSLLQAV